MSGADQFPLAIDGREAPAGEPSVAPVRLDLTEHRLDGDLAFGVKLGVVSSARRACISARTSPEHVHQTIKNWLARRDAPPTIEALQAQLDTYAEYYNTQRPHRAIARRAPATVWTARPHATPTPTPTRRGLRIHEQFRVRTDRVDTTGKLTLRHGSRLPHLGVGRTWAGTKILMLVRDPTRDSQPQSPSSARPQHAGRRGLLQSPADFKLETSQSWGSVVLIRTLSRLAHGS
jgi:hypothetical protein